MSTTNSGPIFTHADFGIALLLFLITLVFFVYNFAFPLRRERLKILRFPLYAVRHKLIKLVAEGKLREDDPIFRSLYSGVNSLIPRIKPVTLRTMVQALRENALYESVRAAAQERRAFFREIAKRGPEVKEVAEDLFSAIASVVIARSVYVLVATWFAARWTDSSLRALSGFRMWLRKASQLFRKAASHVLKAGDGAYDVYQTVNQASRELKAA